MPQVVGFFKVAAAAWKAWAVKHAVAAFIIKTVAMVAISTVASRALTRKPSLSGNGLNSSGSPFQMGRDPEAPRRLVIGEVRVSSPCLPFAHVSGAANEVMHMVMPLTGRPINAIKSLYLADELVPLDGSGNATGTYAGLLSVKRYLGNQTTADADLMAAAPGVWESTDVGFDIGYMIPRFVWDQNKYPGGLQNVSAVVEGCLFYDPRDGLTKYTKNPALVLRAYLLLPEGEGGGGFDVDEIDDASFIEAANVCDEDIPLDAGGTEKRYELNGVIELDTTAQAIIDEICAAMGGKLYHLNGSFVLRAGAWRVPVGSLDESCLRGPITVTNPISRQAKFNAIKGTFADPAKIWQRDSWPAVKSNTFATEDGGQIWREMNSVLVTSSNQLRRTAKQEMLRLRQGLVTAWPCNLRGLDAMAGENLLLSNALMGWTDKPFEVLEFNFSTERGDDGGIGFACDFVGQETHESIYDWATSEEQYFDPAPNTNLYDPRYVPAPTGLVVAVATLAERTALPRAKLTWNPPSDQHVRAGGFTEIEFKKAADATWLSGGRVGGGVYLAFVNDLQPGVSHDFRIRHINFSGVEGPYTAAASIVATPGLGNYTALLTNEAHTVSCLPDGTPIAGELGATGRAKTTVLAFAGSVALTAVASSPGAGQFSFTIATHAGTATFDKDSASVARADAIVTDAAVGRITLNLEGVLTIEKDFTVTKVNSGNDGDDGTDGDDATVNWLTPDAAVIRKSNAGAYTPSTLNVSAFSKTGAAAPIAYAGRFIIATFNGSTWTDQYTSSGDETTKAYTVPGSILAIRCRLYLAGGTSTLLDEQIVPIVQDGADGAPGAPGAPGPALSYSLTVYWHPSGTGGGSINGVSYTGFSTTVTGLSPGAWVDIGAAGTVMVENFSQWSGGDVGQLDQSPSVNANRILMGGNLSIIADYI